jgi:hypothetical protein
MKWTEIREKYPEKWLLIEALNAHTKADKRVLNQLIVLGSFKNSNAALQKYSKLHRETPERELYVFHTSRARLSVIERRWVGIRGTR